MVQCHPDSVCPCPCKMPLSCSHVARSATIPSLLGDAPCLRDAPASSDRTDSDVRHIVHALAPHGLGSLPVGFLQDLLRFRGPVACPIPTAPDSVACAVCLRVAPASSARTDAIYCSGASDIRALGLPRTDQPAQLQPRLLQLLLCAACPIGRLPLCFL